ncbi:MAG: adenylate/guanylate cyclase domain-containing protein [Actinomycetota bacterium]
MSDTRAGEGQRSADGLISFVPRLAVELARAPGNRHVKVEGSMLSADISGFTALSEKLADKGKAGAEEITELINTCFTGLIGEAYAQNGEILKFGGDAILVVFRGDDHERRCAAAGLAMQHTLHAMPTAKKANLTMTVGAHTGTFDAFLVGSAHRELLVTGAEATTVIDLEGNAEKGETLVSAELLAAVPELDSIAEYGGGHRIDGLLDAVATGPLARPDLDIGGSDLADLISSAVSTQLGGVLHLGGEHRQLGICFVMVGGVTEHIETVGGPAAADELGSLVDHIVEACDRFGTAFLHSDIAGHGAKFVLTAGAPTAHGNNAEAVLRAALESARAVTPFELKLGIQVGRGFAGFLGAPARRAYTVMGDPVNTAARMLGRAGHRDVIAMDDVVRATDTVFVSEELEPFMVKGKSEPVRAHRVTEATDETRRDLRQFDLVGRRHELELLADIAETGGRVVEIVGPAGSGKSRLIDAAIQRNVGPVLRGSCTQYGVTSPYSVFRPLLRSALGIDLYTDAVTTGDILTKVVRAECDHLAPMLPLLAVPFGAEVPSTDEADAIDAEFRRAVLDRTMTEFLRAISPGQATVVLEDVQWIDEASAALLTHLSGQVADTPWMLIVTRRDDAGWQAGEIDGLVDLRLAPMADDEIARLVIDTSARSLSDTEVDTIVGRAAGNPLFAVELTRAISENAGAAIPDSVERLLASRIDRLDPASRLYVRMASVLGLEATIDEVDAVVQAEAPGLEPDPAALSHILEPRGKNRIGFSNALYRDAAYEGLPYNRRRRLHRVVAEYLELSFDEETAASASASLLSLHYAEAGVHPKAWAYGVLAGDLARMQWANHNAAVAYRRALTSAGRIRDIDREVVVRVAEALSDCLLATGDFGGANAAIDRARKANHDLATEVNLMRKRGIVAERQGETTRAVRWFSRARKLLPGGTFEKDLLRASAQLNVAQAGVHHRRGDNDTCLEIARVALLEAEEAGDLECEARSLHRLHLATLALRRPDDERFGPRALELFKELEDHDRVASVLNNMGAEAYFNGDWTAAIDFYAESASENALAGNTLDLALATMNTAELLSDQGHWQRAGELLTDALRNWEAAGYVAGIAATKLFTGVNERRLENWDHARSLLTEAFDTFTQLGVTELAEDAESRLLELDVFRGRPDLDAIADARSRWGDGHPLRSRIGWIHGVALAIAGDRGEAIATLIAEIDVSEGVNHARTIETVLTLAPDHDRAEEWRMTVEREYRSAGVIAMARLPIAAA